MSLAAIDWAFAQRAGSPTHKLILVAVADHADLSGVSFPSHELLAEKCDCSTKTVGRHLAALETLGVLRRFERRRQNGSRTSDWIILGPEAVDRGEMTDAAMGEHTAEVDAVARHGDGWKPAPKTAPVAAQMTLGDIHPQPDTRSPDSESPDIQDPGHRTSWGGPEPSGEPSATEEGEARERAHTASSSVLSPSLTRVLEILEQAPELHINDAAVDCTLRAFPDADHAQAAYRVLSWVREGGMRACAANRLLWRALEKAAAPAAPARDACRPGRRRPRPPAESVPGRGPEAVAALDEMLTALRAARGEAPAA